MRPALTSALRDAYENTGAPHPNFRLPESNIRFDAGKDLVGWQAPGFDDGAWDTLPVPSNWQLHGHGRPIYINQPYPFAPEDPDPPNIPDHYNPVGSYRTSFEVPAEWAHRRIVLRVGRMADTQEFKNLAFARERLQSRALGGPKNPDGPADPIIVHPDVRRMLLLMKSQTEAARALALFGGKCLDGAHNHPDAGAREDHDRISQFLTPVIKGWSTDLSTEIASLGIQVHGGLGFIEETGAAQHYRDARITTIYEGTTGIQAMDLVGRKTIRDSGKAQRELIAEIRADIQRLEATGAAAQELRTALSRGVEALEQAVRHALPGEAELGDGAGVGAGERDVVQGAEAASHLDRVTDLQAVVRLGNSLQRLDAVEVDHIFEAAASMKEFLSARKQDLLDKLRNAGQVNDDFELRARERARGGLLLGWRHFHPDP